MLERKIKLTDALVTRAELPAGKSEAVLWDSEVTGFGLRLRGGGKSYIVSYRPAGAGRAANMRRAKIGTPGTLTASSARSLAKTLIGKIAAGSDPAAERREAKRRGKARISDLLDRYDAELERRKYVNRKVVIAGLRARLKPLAGIDAAELSGADLADIIDRLSRSGRLGAAEDFRSRCRAFLTWCGTEAKVIPVNPLAGHRKQRATRADRLAAGQHGRALSNIELAAVWNAATPATTFGRFVRFLILTGCRRGEGAGLTAMMVNREADTITLPAQFVKQGRAHIVPITPALDAVLDACPVDARSDLIFPSLRTGGEMSGWHKMTAALVKTSGVKFSFHDLRRTFRTGLTQLGVDTETAELALGHARANLIEIYDRGNGSASVRQAIELWAEHVLRVTAATDTGIFG